MQIQDLFYNIWTTNYLTTGEAMQQTFVMAGVMADMAGKRPIAEYFYQRAKECDLSGDVYNPEAPIFPEHLFTNATGSAKRVEAKLPKGMWDYV